MLSETIIFHPFKVDMPNKALRCGVNTHTHAHLHMFFPVFPARGNQSIAGSNPHTAARLDLMSKFVQFHIKMIDLMFPRWNSNVLDVRSHSLAASNAQYPTCMELVDKMSEHTFPNRSHQPQECCFGPSIWRSQYIYIYILYILKNR